MSELKLYSLGIVVEDKPVGSDFVMVSPVEVLNIQKNGLIKDSKTNHTGNLKNTADVNFSTEIKSSNFLKAKWIPFGHSNRLTAPDVVKNETIILFKFEDVDEYYWTTIFREVELRRLETVLYGFSNLKSGIVEFDKTTSYWFEVDTKNKTIKLHTSMNDGEFTEYDVIIDTKAGTFTMKDKRGNYTKLDSRKDQFYTNALIDITAVAGKTINAQAGTSITAEAGESIKAKAGTSITAQAGKTVEVIGGESISLKAPSIFLEGNVFISGNISTSGANNSAGNLKINGNIEQKGNNNTEGNITVNGNINASGSVIDGGGNTPNHSH